MKLKILVFSTLCLTILLTSCQKETPRVLVFSKTAGFRHESIEAGKAAMVAMAEKYKFQVDTTENDSAFYEDNLKNYHAVVFLNTTGDVLNAEQQNNFERFIQAGRHPLGH
jgi:cytochrome c